MDSACNAWSADTRELTDPASSPMDTEPREAETEGVTDRPVKPLVAIEQPHGQMVPSNPSNVQLDGKSNPREVHEKPD